MKYAVISPFNSINRVTENPPFGVSERASVVEISDEMATQIADGRSANPPIYYFLIDGELKTREEKIEFERLNTVHPELPAWRVRAIAKMTPIGNSNLHVAILDIIAALPDAQVRIVAEEAYLGGNAIARQSPLVLQVAQQLNLTSEQIDAIFIQAVQLPA